MNKKLKKCSYCGSAKEKMRCSICGKNDEPLFPNMEKNIQEIQDKTIQKWKDKHTEHILNKFIMWYINPKMEHEIEDFKVCLRSLIEEAK